MAKKPWSLSTTVRNPERVRNFLRILDKYFKGKKFGKKDQIDYQIRLIQHRIYEPTNKKLTRDDIEHLNSTRPEIPYEVAKRIFEHKDYRDPSMRGRNSVAPLNKMGLCLAKKSEGPVKISPLGEQLIKEEIGLKEVMKNFFYKWELPNPAESRSFRSKDGFCIKPFRATLEIIHKVNEKWEEQGNPPVGVSHHEFNLFVSTTIDYTDIDQSVERLLNFKQNVRSRNREEQKKYIEQYKRKFAKDFFDVEGEDAIDRKVNNLGDYGDNSRRYLHLTEFFVFRGNGRYFDLSPYKEIEIKKLLEDTNPAPRRFDSQREYLSFLRDPETFSVPWATKKSLLKIWEKVKEDLERIKRELDEKEIGYAEREIFEGLSSQAPQKLSINEVEQIIERGREYRATLLEIREDKRLYQPEEFRKVIEALEDIYSFHDRAMWFEHFITQALKAFNDAEHIKGNYPVDDENNPTCHAPGNQPDITGDYDYFHIVGEVTLLQSRDQWYNEGQPVQRHIKDFLKEIDEGEEVFSIFVAPSLHRDTINQFWSGICHGYEGENLKILPLTLDQFIKIMKTELELKENGTKIDREEFHEFLTERFENLERFNEVDEWMEENQERIENWLESQRERVA